MFRWLRKGQEDISRTEPGFEEAERRTPLTGVVLLVIMFIAGLFFGWRAIDDLARVPSRPVDLSFCSASYVTNETAYRPSAVRSPLAYPEFGYEGPYGAYALEEPPCSFNDLEVAAGIPALDQQRRAILRSIRDAMGTERQDYERARQRRQALASEYDRRLQERQAGVPSVTSEVLSDLRQNLNQASEEEQRLGVVLDQKIAAERARSSELKAIDGQLRQAYQPVFAEQHRRLRWYEFKVFLLQIVFVLPLFLLALKLYLKQLKRNSPYAIILTAIVGVMGVLLLRVILVWFWDLFLARLIEVLWEWIKSVEIIRSIVFYLGMLLSFALFGGAVYYLQRRIFDPRRVAIRRFRAKQCPRCQTNLDLSGNYCPQCGHQVKERCPQCGQARYVELPACPSCGQKK
jgi:hypothetical protein